MIRESFQGTTITSKDIEKTSIVLINVNKFQARTDGNRNIGKFDKNFNTVGVGGFFKLNNGANSIYIKNNSLNKLTLDLQYIDAKDYAKTTYLNGAYKFGTKADLVGTIQHYGTSWNDIAIQNQT